MRSATLNNHPPGLIYRMQNAKRIDSVLLGENSRADNMQRSPSGDQRKRNDVQADGHLLFRSITCLSRLVVVVQSLRDVKSNDEDMGQRGLVVVVSPRLIYSAFPGAIYFSGIRRRRPNLHGGLVGSDVCWAKSGR